MKYEEFQNCWSLIHLVMWNHTNIFHFSISDCWMSLSAFCFVQIPGLSLPSRPPEGVHSYHAVLAHPGSQNGLHYHHGGNKFSFDPLITQMVNSHNQWGHYLCVIILSLQHVVFVVKFFVAWMIPDVPSDVKARIKRERYLIQEYLHNYEVEKLKLQLSASYTTEPLSEMSLTLDKHEVLSECL